MASSTYQGRIKQGMGTLIGNAGEYFVVAELLRRYVIADLAPRNAPWVDVLATNQDKSVRIRVKTKTDAARDWVWNARPDGSIYLGILQSDDFTVLVDIAGEHTHPTYFIIPTAKLNKRLDELHRRWEEGKSTRSRTSRMRRIGRSEEDRQWLGQYGERWDFITTVASDRQLAGQND